MKWYEEKPNRLKAEAMAIKEIYPMAKIQEKKGRLVASLIVQGRKAKYLLRVVYPKDFPYEEPKAYIDKPKIEHAEHRWIDDKSLCIEGNVEPPNLSGKIIIDWSINWIKAFENWLDTGYWPNNMRGR